jgi:peptidoglycan hydrolase-like protein with peptidoglycan-binding domain
LWLAITLAFAALVPLVALAPAQPASAYTTIVYNGAGNAPRLGLIGDSTLAAVRWYGTYGDLREYNFIYDAESCRRTIYASCRGREGYAPENVLQVMNRLEGRWGRILILMTGYDDPGYAFDDGVDAVIAEARSQGIRKVMWLTLRTADVSYVAPEFESDSYTFRDNNRILLQKAVQYRGYLQIADWATYSAQHSSWFASDGIHMTPAGGYSLAAYINDQAGTVLDGRTVTPPPNPSQGRWVRLRKGDYGSRVAKVQRALIERGISIPGGADGVFGTYTERAVKTFQTRQDLRASGIVTERTAVRLGVYQRPPSFGSLDCRATVPLRDGDRLNQAACLERHLVARGYRLGIDDVYGGWTADAINYFKAVSGLRPNGVAGPGVYRALGIYGKRPAKPDCTLSRTYRPGERLPAVNCLKRHLRSRGYTVDDGVLYGDAVRLAVRHFQRHQGLTVHGRADSATLHRLAAYRPPPDKPACRVPVSLRFGDRSTHVRCFERHLRARGFGIRANEKYDAEVAMIVRHLKAHYGLEVNGIAGPALLRKMGIYAAPAETRNPASPPESTTPTTPPTVTAPPTTIAPTTTTAPTTTVPPTTVAAPVSTPIPASTIPPSTAVTPESPPPTTTP